jgi:hypothetical protein
MTKGDKIQHVDTGRIGVIVEIDNSGRAIIQFVSSDLTHAIPATLLDQFVPVALKDCLDCGNADYDCACISGG